MSESDTDIQPNTIELPYRRIQNGRVYDRLEPNRPINIFAVGKGRLVIDTENLQLDNITRKNLTRQWASQKDNVIEKCRELRIDIDPFIVFTYHLIQRKAISILGMPENTKQKQRVAMYSNPEPAKLSAMKGMAMCSEFAVLEAYLAQLINEPAHLIVGTTINSIGWREEHMFTWISGIDAVLEGTLAHLNQFPALMVPTQPANLQTLESGIDIVCRRVGTNHIQTYGLNPGGFEHYTVTRPPSS